MSWMKSALSWLRRSSPFTQSVSLLLILLHLSSWLTSWPISYLALTPGFFWPPHLNLWTAFTGFLIEPNLVLLVVDVFVVFMTSQLLEPLWGTLEMLLFMLTVNTISYVAAASFLFVLFMITENVDLLFATRVQGLGAYVAGLMVATKQIMPDLMLIKLPVFGKIYNRHLPLLFVVIINLLVVTTLTDGVDALLADLGWIVSWVYLRFYQVHNNGARGDMADAFNFASFFPNVLQPPVAKVADILFEMFVRIGACEKPLRQYNMAAANPEATISIALPGSSGVTQDSERRRQIALKALSARLNASPPIELGAVRSNEDNNGDKWPDVEADADEKNDAEKNDAVLVDIGDNENEKNKVENANVDSLENKEETRLDMSESTEKGPEV